VRPDWQERAACIGRDDLPWDHSGAGLLPRGLRRDPRVVQALEVCATCPVRVACLADAKRTEVGMPVYGIRGGRLAPERANGWYR
jgi:hypothetical protein